MTTNRAREWDRWRRDPFVLWVKSLPCPIAHEHAGPIDFDHHPTVGSAGRVHSRGLPLCRAAHGEKDIGVATFQRKYGIDLDAFCDWLRSVFDGMREGRIRCG